LIEALLSDMTRWMEEKEYQSVQQLQGSLSQKHAIDPGAYERINYLQALESFTPPDSVRY
jgi:dihydroorotate dehydrogenase (fumarate)